ncbi:MAG: hypothetical protein HYW34_02515 [Candidatus Brennerbacteria bacterium]|nr:hypothetical protein [Candidatus Brennerbacteria bacterium]
MEKITGLVLLIIGAGVFLYLLPFFAPVFGFNVDNFSGTADSSVSGQIFILNNGSSENETAVWHSSLMPDIFEIQNSPYNNSVLYAATSRGIFISRDNGKNWYAWSDLERKIDGASVYKIVFDKSFFGRAFIAAFKNNRGYVYETEDNLFSLNQIFDVQNERVYAIEFFHNNQPGNGQNILIGLSDGRILSYSPETKEFRPFAHFESDIYGIKAANSHLYITTKSNGIFVRAGGSDKFESLASGDILGQSLKSVAVEEKTGSPLYAASLADAFSSFNQGFSWNGIQTVLASRDSIDSIFLSPLKELYLASGIKLYRSRDNGQSWQMYFSLDEKSKRKISAVYFGENGKIIIGTKE